MKTALLLSLALLLSTFSISSNACKQPPPGLPRYQIQNVRISKIFSDETITAAIIAEGKDVVIKSIKFTNPAAIKLSNNCTLKVTTDNTNAEPGTCPELLPLKVVERICK